MATENPVNRRKIYLAGPMRGLPNLNFDAFHEARARWESAGWQVMSPASIDLAVGLGPQCHSDDTMLRQLITMDVACICNCDAIAMLPGWEKSMGSTVELALAQFLGLTVYNAEDMREIHPPSTPWRITREVCVLTMPEDLPVYYGVQPCT